MARQKPRADIEIRDPRRTYEGVVWHHSTPKTGVTYDWDAVREYHTSYRVDARAVNEAEYRRCFIQHKGKEFGEPMRAPGYHYCVEFVEGEDGSFAPKIHVGRSLELSGEHLNYRSRNPYSDRYVGLLAIGNFDAKAVPATMWDTCLRLTRSLMDSLQFDAARVLGHGEVDRLLGLEARSCPGSLWDLAKFRKDL